MSKQYLVIGGSSGIGLALTKKLQQQGDKVVATSRTAEEVEQLSGVDYLSYDATDPEGLTIEVESLDGIAYCPGSINLKPFHRLKPADFKADFEVNVMGAVNTIQQVLPLLKKSANASIVLFSTVAVGQGMPFHASVASAKGAVEGLARSLAAELAPKIRVNCIAPSIVDTPLAERLLSSPEKKEASAKRHPLNKVGSPEDIAHMASFLLGEESHWMTGQVLGIDGGMSSLRLL